MENDFTSTVALHLEQGIALYINHSLELIGFFEEQKMEQLVVEFPCDFLSHQGHKQIEQASELMELNAIYFDSLSRIKEELQQEFASPSNGDR
ncbi:hypothetical protein [Dyadobacter sp. 32]|uniref:hypothetical protein n=1 Tax=Dyadobacter sp. 32 TaxID=538966 RepID=UPI0011EF4368